MAYLQLKVQIREDQFSQLDDLLSRSGALSVSAMDAEDQPILEPKPGETPLWQNLSLTALFPANKNQAKVINRIKPHLNETQQASLSWTEVPEEAWERAWMQHYQPICFAEQLWVGSTEHTPPDALKAILFLDPGLAFGTGSHPTTYLCLEWLSTQDLIGKTLIDYGCGSGILMLAALKLGAHFGHGVDLDPQALTATKDNAERNQIQGNFSLDLPDTFSIETRADILIANILANPLIELAHFLSSLLNPKGKIVLSGLLHEQAASVKKAYALEINWINQHEKDGWICLVGEKIVANSPR
ncbi:MAG: 50S ribosomal protein L11 methyltransferase [Gammaproteobacteria bacterium]|nr:50S ribosomal protein L11 methyltransferase [Gammaproteobacteria bacterium]